MQELIEILKTPGANPAVAFIVLGWVVRELVELRRSRRLQGVRMGRNERDVARCLAALNLKPSTDDDGQG